MSVRAFRRPLGPALYPSRYDRAGRANNRGHHGYLTGSMIRSPFFPVPQPRSGLLQIGGREAS
jgi:hypothetical protein